MNRTGRVESNVSLIFIKQFLKNIKMKKDHPGVFIPPPLIYLLIFFIAYFLQKIIPINHSFFNHDGVKTAGILFFIAGVFFIMQGVWKFIQTGNTLITVKPASSLQQTGIYKFTRNPMYFGFIFLYLAFTCFFGNWWHIILLPGLIIIMQEYVIKKEEKYLEREFNQTYVDYKKKVRRWI
jgi:protein-S-isoprenylcysteine O-methyltransferase Ste14